MTDTKQNQSSGPLDIDPATPEDKLQELKKSIISKLTDGYGYELQDETLSDWIILIAVTENKPKDEVQQDLVEFISDNAPDFVNWFWTEAKRICAKPEPKKVVKPKEKLEKKESKSSEQPKDKSKDSAQKHTKPKGKNEQLFKKAVGDVKKSVAKDHEKGTDKSSSYVKTEKDGRKVINLNKSKEQHQTGRDERRRDAKQTKYTKKQDGGKDSNILNRIKTKGKEDDDKPKGDNKKTSKLDMSLDSIIKNQKKTEYETHEEDWYGHGHGHGYKRGHYEVTEEFIHDPTAGGYNKSYKRPKRNEGYEVEEVGDKGDYIGKQKYEKEGEGEGEDQGEHPKGGYKGKKFNPYYSMGYMPPGGGMYGYPPMFGMDPYAMMNPYYGGGYKGGSFKPKKFKNKSLVIKKTDKGKPAEKDVNTKSEEGQKQSNLPDNSNAAPSSSAN